MFDILSIKPGCHLPGSAFCMMEAVAFVAGEPWSDHPECACPIISSFLRSWNDVLPIDADRDRLLKTLIPKIVNTRSTKKVELKRGLMAADWLIRVHTPVWLRLAGLITQAESLEHLPEITSVAQFPSIRGPIEAVRIDAWAVARVVGGDVPVGTAEADAAEVAAEASRAVVGAAWDYAWDVSWVSVGAAARENPAPTVAALQKSALALVKRMIAAK